MTIPQMLERWKSVNLKTEVPIIIQDTNGEMVKLNREQLKVKGLDSESKRLKPYQSPAYALDKNRMNPSPGLFNPDLFVTGRFHGGFYANVKASKSILFGSTDFKSERLEKSYGKQIFGLTKDNKRVYLDTTVMPKIREYITKQTGLRFK